MQLSTEAITNFQKIYLDRFGVKLSNDEANRKGLELMEFIAMIYKPIPKEWYELNK